MKAILVTPDDTSVVDIENNLDGLQEQVDGMIQAIPFPDRDDVTCYINEEGKFLCPENSAATKMLKSILFPNDYICGNLLILGFNINNGENFDCPEDLISEIIR